MALAKQPIPIVFAEGIDTKTDEKLVLPTKLLELENGVFTKRGRINKRNGYDILNRQILGSDNSISAATGISTFKDELNLFTGTKLYSYVEASEAWSEKGTATSVTISNKSIIRNTNQQTNPDYAHNNGLGCYVWKDSVGGVRVTVVDEATGTIVMENQSLSGTGISPRVIGTGRYFFIFYIESTTLKLRTIQVSTPSVLGAAQDISTAVDGTDKIYEAQKVGERVYIAYNHNDVSGAIKLLYITPTKVVSSEVSYTGEEASDAISICSDADDNIWVSYSNGAEVKLFIQNYALDTEVLAEQVVETITDVRNIASIESSSGIVTLLYEKTNSPANYVKKVTVTLGGTVGTPAVFVRSVGLASKFFEYNDQFHIALAHSSTLQSSYFIYALNGDIVTKCQNGTGGGLTAASILPSVQEIDTGKFIYPSLQKGVLQTEAGVVFTALGVTSTLIDFTSLNNFVTAELGNQLHIVGGILQSYDGASIVETGFNVFPEGVVATPTSVGTGNLANGLYNYAVLYAWIDNQGQIHRSAEGFASATVAGGPSDITLTIPTLRITKKENVFIEIYRTEVNGTIYYKLTSNTSLTANDATVDTITYVDDTVLDTTLISGELLYTTGGELENIAPPSSSVIVNWKNRIALKSSDEENTIWYSKIRQEGKPVEFSDFLKIIIDSKGGDISALGVLDDKLIIFKEDQIYMQSGDGPNNLGTQSDFGLPESISSDVGCVDVNSVVSTPVGLMFKSTKGIYLLNRGLAVSYIGAPVEAFNELRITAANLVPDSNQVRFTTEDGACLVYDYMFEQWSTFTNHQSVGASKYSGQFCFAKSNGQVYIENPNSFSDGAQGVKLKLVSSWIQVGNVQGLQRIYKLFLLGEYKSSHRLKVEIGYDFEPFFTQEVTIDVDEELNPTTYGEVSPYGSEEVYGGEFPLYQWKIYPKRQKCQAFRISIEDIMDDTFGESFNITSMRIEAGMKQGSNKLPSAKSFGTE